MRKYSVKTLVDKLGKLDAQIANLEAARAALRDQLLMTNLTEAEGNLFRATISRHWRETLIKQDVVGELGEDWVKDHSRKSPVTTVRVVSRIGITR